MVELEPCEGVGGAEEGEEVEPGQVVRVTVGVTANKMWCLGMQDSEIVYVGLKFNKRSNKLFILPGCGKINDSVKRGYSSWIFEENCLEV